MQFGKHEFAGPLSATALLTTIAAAVIGLVTFDKEITLTDLPAALFLTALGGFGALFSAKHYERFQFHIARGRSYRDELEAMLSDTDWKGIRRRADERHEPKFPRLVGMRQHKFWIYFSPETVEHIQELIKGKRKPNRVIETPVFEYV